MTGEPSNTVEWEIDVSDDFDRMVRRHLASQGRDESELSAFVEECIARWVADQQ